MRPKTTSKPFKVSFWGLFVLQGQRDEIDSSNFQAIFLNLLIDELADCIYYVSTTFPPMFDSSKDQYDESFIVT